MKIAVVGPDCSGKTTLSEGIAKALTLNTLANPRESVLAESRYPTMYEWANALGELEPWIDRQIAAERNVVKGVVDGGVIDQLCFLERWAWHRFAPDRFEALRARVRIAAASYDRIVVMPPRIVTPSAPWRFRSETATLQMHRLTTALITELQLSPFLLAPTAEATATLTFVLNAIS